ncbi:MAG: PH domain-containing protein [Planctomycetota bacterium]|nr:PH domain-containing protein [Planctomycetota bacterium]MDA0935122.1 PH domain-containing protein [Planctomycetota bacterium]MDA1222100.1 PH domain-containing protein [Planctomycetota bacterium]
MTGPTTIDDAPGDVSSPDTSGPTFERLDRRVVPYWLVSGLFGNVFFVLILVVALVAFREPLGDNATLATIAVAVLGGALVLFGLVIPPLAYRRWCFSIDADLLVARYGVVFHEEKAIPVSRLQHVDLSRGPVERLFGLATLVVHTAGTEAASFRLPGLTPPRAEQLRDAILEARGDDTV